MAIRLSYVVQYYMHPHQLGELVRRLQHPQVEVLVHMDSHTTADLKAAKEVEAFSPVRVVYGGNVHELRAYNRMAQLARGELIALAQDDTLPPSSIGWVDGVLATFEAMPRLAALGLHRGATRLWPTAMPPTELGQLSSAGATRWPPEVGGACNASSSAAGGADAISRPPQPHATSQVTFAASLALDPLVVRRGAFASLGGLNESYSARGAPGLGMEEELVARLWEAGHRVGVACPSKGRLFHRNCGGRGTWRTPAARDARARAALHNRGLFRTAFAGARGARIERLVEAANTELHAPTADGRRIRATLRTLWPGCVAGCANLLRLRRQVSERDRTWCEPHRNRSCQPST